MQQFDNQSGKDFVDISSELYRVYTFPGDNKVVITKPLQLSVSSGGHRIFDEQGFSHYVPKGWIHLTWEAKAGQPHFVK